MRKRRDYAAILAHSLMSSVLRVEPVNDAAGPEDSTWKMLLREFVMTQSGTPIVGAELFLTKSSSAAIQLESPPGGLFVSDQVHPAYARDHLLKASAPLASGLGIAGAHWAEHGASTQGGMDGSKHGGSMVASVFERMDGSKHGGSEYTNHLAVGRRRRSMENESAPSSPLASSRRSIFSVPFGTSRASAANVKTLGMVKLEGQPLSSLLSGADLAKLAKE